MSVKRTSMDAIVYGKLAQFSRGSDSSFSKTKDQLVEQAILRYQVAQASRRAAEKPSVSILQAQVLDKELTYRDGTLNDDGSLFVQ